MSRLIDADALKDLLMKYIGLTNGFDRAFSEAPSIDIVRCKECVHCYYNDEHKMYRCTKADIEHWMWNADRHFCSYGERRECNDR